MRKALVFTGLIIGLAVITELAAGARRDYRLLRTDIDAMPVELMVGAIKRGETKFRKNCASCHAERGSGDPSRGVPNLSDSDWLYGSGQPSEIERVVAYGIRSNNPKGWNLALMPAFAHLHPTSSDKILPLSPSQIRDVVEYLVYLQHEPPESEAAARGAQVYASVGGCYDCHSPDAKGDGAIGAPNLTDHITLYGNGGRQALIDSISDGRQGICPAWLSRLHAVGVREVALYVYSLSHSSGT